MIGKTVECMGRVGSRDHGGKEAVALDTFGRVYANKYGAKPVPRKDMRIPY